MRGARPAIGYRETTIARALGANRWQLLESVNARYEFAQVRRGGPRRACAESLRGDRETVRLGERERDRHGLSV
jgi:hypothetical protein